MEEGGEHGSLSIALKCGERASVVGWGPEALRMEARGLGERF